MINGEKYKGIYKWHNIIIYIIYYTFKVAGKMINKMAMENLYGLVAPSIKVILF